MEPTKKFAYYLTPEAEEYRRKAIEEARKAREEAKKPKEAPKEESSEK